MQWLIFKMFYRESGAIWYKLLLLLFTLSLLLCTFCTVLLKEMGAKSHSPHSVQKYIQLTPKWSLSSPSQPTQVSIFQSYSLHSTKFPLFHGMKFQSELWQRDTEHSGSLVVSMLCSFFYSRRAQRKNLSVFFFFSLQIWQLEYFWILSVAVRVWHLRAGLQLSSSSFRPRLALCLIRPGICVCVYLLWSEINKQCMYSRGLVDKSCQNGHKDIVCTAQ